MERHLTWRRRLRRWGLPGIDVVLLVAGLLLGTLGRYDGALLRVDIKGLALVAAGSVVTFVVLSSALRLHQGRYPVGSVDELLSIGAAVGAAAAVGLALDVLSGSRRLIPLSVPLVAPVVAVVLMLAVRLVVRRQREGMVRPRTGERALVFGAGDAGHQLIRSMLGDARSHYLPVGMLDDDPTKRHARYQGVRMLGGRRDISSAAAETGATLMVIALPSADSALVRDIAGRARTAGLAVKVLPRLADVFAGQVGIRDVRDINIADLLGRRQIDTNLDAIAGYLSGKRVLVTGAGGSIGSELCRQISRYNPAELVMLDRDESALHAVQLSLKGEARLDLPEVVLCDIRDVEAVQESFVRRRPEVVFHAAALKHVTMLEQYESEAWKTNVLGTRNVLAAASAVGVSQFINVSTDKAADPVNVLGRSKRMAERLTATYAARSTGAFLSVRFGNVLGSRGSVLETFAAQIARGGPVTVTHPEVTRYFMTIPEAVQLVIQAGAIGQRGEALVLDMGQPVRIAEVAEQLIAMANRPIEIAYTGLRAGEKLHETLFGDQEVGARPVHPLISHVPVPPLDDDPSTELEVLAPDDVVAVPLPRDGRIAVPETAA